MQIRRVSSSYEESFKSCNICSFYPLSPTKAKSKDTYKMRYSDREEHTQCCKNIFSVVSDFMSVTCRDQVALASVREKVDLEY